MALSRTRIWMELSPQLPDVSQAMYCSHVSPSKSDSGVKSIVSPVALISATPAFETEIDFNESRPLVILSLARTSRAMFADPLSTTNSSGVVITISSEIMNLYALVTGCMGAVNV